MRAAYIFYLTFRAISAHPHPDETSAWLEAKSLGIAEEVHGQRHLATAIVHHSRASHLDPLLTMAVIRAESAFNPRAVSKAGALGLMQVMPETGRYWASLRGETLRKNSALFDIDTNLALGTSYLSFLIRRFGTLETALCAYNVGPGAAKTLLADREARRQYMAGYPTKVLTEYRRLKARSAQMTASVKTPPARARKLLPPLGLARASARRP